LRGKAVFWSAVLTRAWPICAEMDLSALLSGCQFVCFAGLGPGMPDRLGLLDWGSFGGQLAAVPAGGGCGYRPRQAMAHRPSSVQTCRSFG